MLAWPGLAAQVHGVLATLTLDLYGIGLCAKTNVDELLNFTMQQVGMPRPGGPR